MPRKSTNLQVNPVAKHPKYNKLAVTDIPEKPVDFFNDTAWVPNLALAIILQT